MPTGVSKPKLRRVLNSYELMQDLCILFLRSRLSSINVLDAPDAELTEPQRRMKVMRGWFERKWLKEFQVMAAERFLNISTKIPGCDLFADDNAPKSSKMYCINPFTKQPMELYPQTKWDMNDAENGTLCYYLGWSSSAWNLEWVDKVCELHSNLDLILREDPERADTLNTLDSDQILRIGEELHRRLERRNQERLARLAAELLAQQAEAERQAREGGELREVLIGEPVRISDLVYSSSTVFSKEAMGALIRNMLVGVDYIQVKSEPNLEGFIWMNLMTQKALEFESLHMHHCVYTYSEDVKSGEVVVLSLRKNDHPHFPLMTVELAERRECLTVGEGLDISELSRFVVVQAKGAWNVKPKLEYLTLLDNLVKTLTPESLTPLLEKE